MYKLSLNAVAAAAAIKVSRAGSRMGSFVHVSDATLRAKKSALIVHS
jgi:menaquinone-dependent protoporphyrinogen IX oxidase